MLAPAFEDRILVDIKDRAARRGVAVLDLADEGGLAPDQILVVGVGL